MVTIMRKDIKKIRQVLKDYAQLKKDLALINARNTLISSPSFEGTGSHSNTNHTGSKFVNHANLSWQLHRVEEAINNIEDSKYRFIINKYIINKKYNRQELCDRYNIGLRSFNSMKNRALVEFAKNYGMDQLLDEMNKPQVYE